MDSAVVLLTRELRVHDHPALAQAARVSRHVVPLFVFDRAILKGDCARPNRLAFLLESLEDLRSSLQQRGADLVARWRDPAVEAVRLAAEVGAGAVFVSEDVSGHAQRRRERLARACAGERRRAPRVAELRCAHRCAAR